MVGEGPVRTKLEAQANRLRLSEVVHFSGWVEHRYLPDYIKAAALFDKTTQDSCWGWAFVGLHSGSFAVTGLKAGTYQLEFIDPWNGEVIPGLTARTVTTELGGKINIDFSEAIKLLREETGMGLDKNRMSVMNQFPHAGRNQAGPVFIRFDLFWNANQHSLPPRLLLPASCRDHRVSNGRKSLSS